MIEAAVAIFNDRNVNLVFHAGDFVAPFTSKPFAKLKAKMIGVFGNNDGEVLGLESKFQQIGDLKKDPIEEEIGGRKIAMTHRDGVVEALSRSGIYDVVIYGHTHKADVRKVGKTLVINPGEAGGWVNGKSTLAVVDLESLKAELIEIPNP
jgi:putative phosphoesterase